MKRLTAGLIGAAVAETIAGAAPAMASTTALQVQGFVVSAKCLNGDTAQVTLSARSRGGTGTVRYRWDFTNNGSFDTAASTNPTVVTTYGDELTVTAKVGARDAARNIATDLVTFTTPRCEG